MTLVQLIDMHYQYVVGSCEVVRGCASVTFDDYGRGRVKTYKSLGEISHAICSA